MQVSVAFPAVAVITAVPTLCAVTFPFSSTEATSELFDSQLTLSVELLGTTVAIKVSPAPDAKASSDLLSLIAVAGTGFFVRIPKLFLHYTQIQDTDPNPC